MQGDSKSLTYTAMLRKTDWEIVWLGGVDLNVSPLFVALPLQISGQIFSHLDQFLCLVFAQLTYRESLCDIKTCLCVHQAKLYHLDIRCNTAPLADTNEQRDRHICEDFELNLIQIT